MYTMVLCTCNVLGLFISLFFVVWICIVTVGASRTRVGCYERTNIKKISVYMYRYFEKPRCEKIKKS